MFGCCDESGVHKSSRWWAYGALWLPDDQVPAFEADATALRQRRKCWGEFKWGHVAPKMLDAYQELIGLALARPDLRFTSMVVDSHRLTRDEMQRYHEGRRDLAYLKFMRFLLRERIDRLVGLGHTEFTLLYDKLSVGRELERDLRDVLKSDLKNISGDRRIPCEFRHLSQVDSRTLHLMQVADLMTGATWHAWEGKGGGSEDKEAARRAIRAQIEEWAGGSLTYEHFRSERYYCLWRLALE